MLFDSFEAYDVQETRRISKEEGSTLRLITQVCKKIQKQIPLAEIAEMLEEDISVIQSTTLQFNLHLITMRMPFLQNYIQN